MVRMYQNDEFVCVALYVLRIERVVIYRIDNRSIYCQCGESSCCVTIALDVKSNTTIN